MSIPSDLCRLSRQCEAMCREAAWLNNAGVPGYRLILSSVESFETGSGYAILGINPGGTPNDVKAGDNEKAFQRAGYSGYLDDEWTQVDRAPARYPAAGQGGLQRAVQEVAMVLAGEDLGDVLQARNDRISLPEQRIGRRAVALLRSTPSANILPFAHKDITKLPIELGGDRALAIGWSLLTSAQGLRVIVTLANRKETLPLSELTRRSNNRTALYEEPVHRGMRRTYRELRLLDGPLKGTLVVGLPALIHDYGRSDVMEPLLQVLSRRLPTIQEALSAP